MDTPHDALFGRSWTPGLPVSGAWRPGDPVGERKFHSCATDRPLALESGETLRDVTCAYQTWGTLADAADNAVLVCHALTGDAHAYGPQGAAHPTEGWWNGIIGPGEPIDTDRYFVVCVNVLGGCQGSTGPASLNPDTGQPFGSSFPTVTIRDMVRVQADLSKALGIDRWLSVVGGSMGGMQVLEWALMYPDRVRSVAPVATTLAASTWQIAWSAVGRTALALDPRWRNGDYYDAEPGDGPHAGLALARSVAQVTYRSEGVFEQRFGREVVDPATIFGAWDRFQVESYLDYHGEKLVRRFDANSYLVLNKAMDLHDVGRGRGGVASALARLECPVLTLSIDSDTLYHPHQQREIHDEVVAAGGVCEYVIVNSPDGHDGFLLATEEVGGSIGDFLQRVEKGDI